MTDSAQLERPKAGIEDSHQESQPKSALASLPSERRRLSHLKPKTSKQVSAPLASPVSRSDPEEEIKQDSLASIFRDPSSHSREEFLQALLVSTSGESYGDNQWQKVEGGWSTPETQTLYGRFREVYPSLSALSMDLGFMSHLPEVMRILDAGEITIDDPVIAKEQLKERLGVATLWRGTMLTDDELEQVKQNGMISPVAAIVAQSTAPEQDLNNLMTTSVHDVVETHFHGENRTTPLLSVSSHKEVAIAVGKHYGRKGDGRKFYLFELKVPEIDRVFYTSEGIRTPYKITEMKRQNPDYGIKVTIDGEETRYEWDDKVESFMFWKIDPGEIVNVTQENFNETTWNGRKTVWNNTPT